MQPIHYCVLGYFWLLFRRKLCVLPLFMDCFEVAALAASFASHMVAGVSFSDSGPLEVGRESNDFCQRWTSRQFPSVQVQWLLVLGAADVNCDVTVFSTLWNNFFTVVTPSAKLWNFAPCENSHYAVMYVVSTPSAKFLFHAKISRYMVYICAYLSLCDDMHVI